MGGEALSEDGAPGREVEETQDEVEVIQAGQVICRVDVVWRLANGNRNGNAGGARAAHRQAPPDSGVSEGEWLASRSMSGSARSSGGVRRQARHGRP